MRTECSVLRSTELPADFADTLRGMTERGDSLATLADVVTAFDHLWDVIGVPVIVDQMY